MSALFALITFIAALLSAPSSFLLLWLTYKKTKETYIRPLAYSMLGLCAILFGNGLNLILESNLQTYDLRIAFLIMNEVFLGSILTNAFFCLFVHAITGKSVSARHKVLFWAFTILFFFLVLALPIFWNGNGTIEISHGYLASTLYGAICQGYGTIYILIRRKRLDPSVPQFLPPFLVVLLGLGLISVANDIFHFGNLLGGPNLPFSPIFVFLISVSSILFCLKELSHPREGKTECANTSLPDFGLTDRELEILPLLLEGISNETIAEQLFISPHTVKNHVTSILRKARVTNRFELLKLMTTRN